MASLPKTHYARSGDVNIAYQVIGDGPLDLVVVPGLMSHVEFWHELPGFTGFLERLARFARVVIFDKRGSGMSDHVPGAPTLEVRMDDARAVMDAVGVDSAALLGVSEGGALAALFAATYPERTQALAIYGGFPRWRRDESYPGAFMPAMLALYTQTNWQWGQGAAQLPFFAPSLADDPAWQELWTRLERYSASPGAFTALVEMNARIDVRGALPTIRVPTLVVHRKGDRVINPVVARIMADLIPGARYVEVEGVDHLYFVGDIESWVGVLEEFLTGERAAPPPLDRVLATVLMTDIVGSTRRAAELGDRRWRELLDRHDRLADRQIERFRGRKIKSTGDGVLATFDGPARAIDCGLALREGLAALGLEMTAGVHTGEIELRGEDVGGIAVHIAARIREEAAPGEVLVSRTVTDLVAGSQLCFEDLGERALAGIDQRWRVFRASRS